MPNMGPLLLSAADRAARRFGVGLEPFDAAELIAQAERKNGGPFRSRDFEPALAALLRSLDEEAELSVFGRFSLKWDVLRLLGNVLRFFGKADHPGLMNAIVGTPTAWGIIRNLPRMFGGQEMKGRDVLDRPCREMIMEANTSELLEPIIDGEYYRNVKKMVFRVGPRVRIPKVVAPKAAKAA